MTTAVLNAKASAISFPQINWKIICFSGFFIALVLLVFYVLQINYLTSGSYLISTYERQIGQLAEENKNLQVSFAESSFLGQALEKIQALDFQKVQSVKYMQIPDNYLAVAK